FKEEAYNLFQNRNMTMAPPTRKAYGLTPSASRSRVRDLNHQLEESRTQKNKYVAMKFVGGKVKEKSVTILFGGGKAGVGISHTSQKAGVGPVPAVSANDAPPTGPQECVGQDDATRLGQASKSSKSLFA
ncbi:hypothetical protein THAOC_33231, partial [Thalassiosira oceanica]